jgi:hypothetical protein
MPFEAELIDILWTVVIVAAVVAGSAATLFSVQRFWSASKRREHNDLIGWQISVTGTMYAVVLGFMLFAVWNNFQIADANASAEANSIVNVVRSAQGLPSPAQTQIRSLAANYLDARPV